MQNATVTDDVLDRHVKHFNELNFTVVAEVHEYRVEYRVYEIAGLVEGDTKGVYDTPRWQKADSHRSPDPVETLEEAEVYLSGHVKWDGCSNWHFDAQERSMLHACSREDLENIGKIMAACWDWTEELCPTWMY